MNLENGFSTSKKFKSQTSGNDLWWFGGGEVAWQSLVIAKTNIPTAKRAGLTIGVLENGKVVEYIWQPNDVTDNGLVLKTKEIKVDDAFYFDENNVLRPNITEFTRSIIYDGGSKIYDLVFYTTKIRFLFRNGKKQATSAYQFTNPSTLELLITLNIGDEIDIIYEHFINIPE